MYVIPVKGLHLQTLFICYEQASEKYENTRIIKYC